MDVAPAAVLRVEHPEPLGQRVVRPGQVRRAAQRLRHRRRSPPPAPAPTTSASRPSPPPPTAPCGRPSAPPASFFGSVAGDDPLELRPLARRQLRRPAPPRPPRAAAAARARSPATPRGSPPAPRTADRASRRSRGPWRSPRPRAASRAPPWCPAWSAPRSRYASGRRSSPAGRLRLRLGQRPVDVVRVVAVALVHRPARGGEARLLVGDVGEARPCRRWRCRCRPTSRSAGESRCLPASPIASWLIPSIRQPSPAITQVV